MVNASTTGSRRQITPASRKDAWFCGYAIRCLRAGAAGYLNKETVMTEVVQAVRKVCRGGKYLSRCLAEKVVVNLYSDARPAHQNLSDREYQVVRMIASGKAVSEIAEELALSVKTITTYRRRAIEKLNLRNNSEIIRYAIDEGLVD
jgi:DNA-binding NarL/FixJ family response regulator